MPRYPATEECSMLASTFIVLTNQNYDQNSRNPTDSPLLLGASDLCFAIGTF